FRDNYILLICIQVSARHSITHPQQPDCFPQDRLNLFIHVQESEPHPPFRLCPAPDHLGMQSDRFSGKWGKDPEPDNPPFRQWIWADHGKTRVGKVQGGDAGYPFRTFKPAAYLNQHPSASLLDHDILLLAYRQPGVASDAGSPVMDLRSNLKIVACRWPFASNDNLGKMTNSLQDDHEDNTKSPTSHID